MLRRSNRPLAPGTTDLLFPRPEIADLPPVHEVAPAAGPCPPGSASRMVCPSSSRCACPLSGELSDAERAVINDISAAASRLTTAITWIFALLALTALVLLMMR